MRVRQWRTSRQRYPQVSTNWSIPTGWVGMGPKLEKSSAQLCTFPNMPTQANTIPAHAGTSANMPARSCRTVEPPSPTHKPLYERYLHRWIRSSCAFRGGRQAALGRVAKGLKSNDLCSGASLPRRVLRDPSTDCLPSGLPSGYSGTILRAGRIGRSWSTGFSRNPGERTA